MSGFGTLEFKLGPFGTAPFKAGQFGYGGGISSFPGETFFKDYAHNRSSLNADYSLGSPTATFTAARSSVAPATYIDANGVVNLVTTSNIPRYQYGYYDSTGYHVQVGLMIEKSGTNLLTRTDGTASSAGLWTGWAHSVTTSGSPTDTNEAASDLTSIVSSLSQRAQYTGSADVAKTIELKSPTSGAATVVQNDVLTVSCWVKAQTVNTGVAVTLRIQIRDNTSAIVETLTSSDILSSLATTWRKFTFTGTVTSATADRANFDFVVTNIDTGDNVDYNIWGAQLEKTPYATSFIPTTTVSLTRGAEVLKYPILNNRTAASETIFIKFSTPSTPTYTSSYTNFLTSTDTKERRIANRSNLVTGRFGVLPNQTDSAIVEAQSSSTFLTSSSYVVCGTFKHVSPYASFYKNGVKETDYTAGDWTDPAWGTSFYIGSQNDSTQQLNGIIQSVAIFNRALTAAEVAQVSAILAPN